MHDCDFMVGCRATSHQSHKLLGRTQDNGRGFGLYAVERIEAGEQLIRWGGAVLGRSGVSGLPAALRAMSLQIDEDRFLVPIHPCAADRVNHSCDPNAGMSGPFTLVALRVIMPGEEMCYDYAMSVGSDYDEFDCLCGAPNCRRRVTGRDWRRPILWDRYAGYFSPISSGGFGRCETSGSASRTREASEALRHRAGAAGPDCHDRRSASVLHPGRRA